MTGFSLLMSWMYIGSKYPEDNTYIPQQSSFEELHTHIAQNARAVMNIASLFTSALEGYFDCFHRHSLRYVHDLLVEMDLAHAESKGVAVCQADGLESGTRAA